MNNHIRIIGGEWRSRQITFSDVPGLRPTPNRVRETLFNWLQMDLPGSRCLDLYAGSGALGLEAASRGAKSVVLVESNPSACRALNDNVVKLNASQVKIVQSEVSRFLAESNPVPFDIVFLDPPFSLNLAVQTCQWLEDKGWLSQYAKIYVEAVRGNTLSDGMPVNWQLLKCKNAGDVRYRLFGRAG